MTETLTPPRADVQPTQTQLDQLPPRIASADPLTPPRADVQPTQTQLDQLPPRIRACANFFYEYGFCSNGIFKSLWFGEEGPKVSPMEDPKVSPKKDPPKVSPTVMKQAVFRALDIEMKSLPEWSYGRIKILVNPDFDREKVAKNIENHFGQRRQRSAFRTIR